MPSPITIHPDCREFVEVIEYLLSQRQSELDNRLSARASQDNIWGPRTWTRTEMQDMVYSSYKQMRRGRITRPPRREVVIDMADYLDCTIEERNRLLVAANFPPIDPYLTGKLLQDCLQPTIEIAQSLDMPAMIINRDWRIHFLNTQMLRLYELTSQQFESLPDEYRNSLRLIFDPDLPLYPALIGNRESWTRMARQTIYGFKTANRLCRFESWYQNLVNEWMSLPEFAHHWQTVRTDISFEQDPSAANLTPTLLLDALIPNVRVHSKHSWLRPLIISTGYFQFDFPQIIAFLPADEQARLALAEIGAITA